MKPGGKAVFAENWGGANPIFDIWRRKTTLRKADSADRGEVILSRQYLDTHVAHGFSSVLVEPLSLTYMLKKYVRSAFLCRLLYAIDKPLTSRLGSFCGESVITLVK
jgi:hypothetical protein